MRFLFCFGVSLLNCTCTIAQMQSDWQAKWANARDYTLAVADAMPEADYAYAPLDTGMMTFGEQLIHLASNINWLSGGGKLEGRGLTPKQEVSPLDKATVRQVLAEAFDNGAKALGQLGYGDLDDEVDWFTGERLTKRRLGLLLFDHVTHHRAQAIVYLRLRGVAAPRYVGW